MILSLTLFVAFTTTFLTLISLNKVALSIGLVDSPCERKIHSKQTPLTGGLGIAVGVGITLLAVTPQLLPDFTWILLGALIMLLTGAYDDFKTLSVFHRFLIQGLTATMVVTGASLQIESLGILPIFGEISLGYLSYPITIIAIVAGINAINLIDGLDGLASGLCFVSFLSLGLVASLNGEFYLASFAAIVSFALVGFLSMNMRFPWQRSAKAFLGDAGSTALGFTIACLLIYSAQSNIAIIAPPTALWFLAIPLIDTLSVIVRRLQDGQQAFKASKDHFHHILLSRYKSVSKVVTIMIALAAGLTIVGLALDAYGSDLLSLSLFIIVGVCHHFGARHLKQKTVQTIESALVADALELAPVVRKEGQAA